MDARQSTLDLVRRYYDAFGRGDWPAMLDCLTEDVAHDVNQGGRETGREAFGRFLERMARHYRERLEELVVMATPDGARAAAEFTVVGAYLATDAGLPEARGQGYRLPAGAFFSVREGRIERVSAHYNLRDWIAQVGG